MKLCLFFFFLVQLLIEEQVGSQMCKKFWGLNVDVGVQPLLVALELRCCLRLSQPVQAVGWGSSLTPKLPRQKILCAVNPSCFGFPETA